MKRHSALLVVAAEDLLSGPDDGLGSHGLKGLRIGSMAFNLFPYFFGIAEGLSAELTV